METAQNRNKRFVVAAAIIGVLAVLAVGARAFVADAFGGPLDALEAIPSDVQMVMVADLAQIRDFTDSPLVDYAVRLGQESGELPPGDPTQAFSDLVETELGIDIEVDVLSWIGRSAAIGVAGDLDAAEPETVIGSIVVRDADAAWRFIDLIVERTLAEVPSATSEETTIDGLRAVILDSGEDPAHFGIKGSHLVIANSRTSLEAAYATLDGASSVFDVEWFESANAELERNAWFKFMMDPAFMNNIYDEMADIFDGSGVERPSPMTALGMSWGFDGERISMEAFYEQADRFENDPVGPLPLSMLATLQNTPDVIFGLGLADDFGSQIIDQMQKVDDGTLEEMTAMSQEVLGVDLVTGGLAQVGGHFIASVAFGDFSTFGDVNVALGIADPAPLIAAFEEIRQNMSADGLVTSGSAGLIELLDEGVTFGVLDGELVYRIDQTGVATTPFVDSEGFAWLEDNFRDGAFLYVDIHRLLQAEQTGLGSGELADLDAMRLGAAFVSGERSIRFTGILEVNLPDGAR